MSVCRGQFSNVLRHLIITSACISGGAKSSEGFLRRKSERMRRSQLEETVGYCLSNSRKLRPRHDVNLLKTICTD